MNLVNQLFDRIFKPVEPLPTGVYHYQSPPDIEKPYRLHLRLEQDGTGLLILNAHTVMHLNQTAAEYCYHFVQQTPEADIVRQIAGRYRISKKEAQSDFSELKTRINTLIATPDIDPVTYLGFDRQELYSSVHSAPYRLDCALTYRTSDGDARAVPLERVERELTLEEWKIVLDKAWQVGIPHIIFTGGEPTLREDLPDLIAYTQQIGQVSGLLTNGLRLVEESYLNSLLEKGLDHLLLVLDPDSEKAWQAVSKVLAGDIHLTVHLSLDASSTGKSQQLIEQLVDLGVYSLSLSAASAEFKNDLITARHAANEHGINLVWDLPVPYSRLHPVFLENEDEEVLADGAGKAWLYVEPDGDVLPSQGMADQILGNMLHDAWTSIWKKDGSA